MAEALLQVMLVEDEKEIRELMALHLLRQGYRVKECSSAEEALTELKTHHYDLLVLDWMLPGTSGVEVLDHMKIRQTKTRVLMVTAKAEPQDIVYGLEKGADDYLTKPFDPTIFLARVKALLRRPGNVQDDNSGFISLAGLSLNMKSYEVSMGAEKLHLTPSEFKLLKLLIQNQGRVLTRDQLIENIQGEGVNVIGRTIDTHVFGLRKKLGPWSDHVETIRGVGYRVKSDIL